VTYNPIETQTPADMASHQRQISDASSSSSDDMHPHHEDGQDGLEEDAYSDTSSIASIPDEDIDFSLTYAL